MIAAIVTGLPTSQGTVKAGAADGDVPIVELLGCELEGDQFTMTAWMTLSGGAIERYGFAYSINSKTTQYKLTDGSLDKWEEFDCTITVNPGDEVWYQAIARNEYGLEGKDDDIFYVPEEEPEIELEAPEITSHESSEDIVAGEDIKFR